MSDATTPPTQAAPPPADPPHDPPHDPAAAVVRARRFQPIWVVPIIAAVIALYLGYNAITSRGPMITLEFRAADGLKAGQTKVRHKAVDLGTVESIRLSDDLSHVIVQVQMQREATAELTDQARFWVVRPRLTASSISGLDTLVSGAYIELDPGPANAADAKPQSDFTGLDEPPAVRSDEPGTSYTLSAARVGALASGSPVLYRDVEVGEVLGWELAPDGRRFTVHVFVRKPYDAFVHTGTHFWNASGVALDLGANGVQLRLESLAALLSGAVAFDTAPDARRMPLGTAQTPFLLYKDQPSARAAGFTRRLPFVTRFEGSVRGLAEGAPVEVYGIQVGSVTSIKLIFDPTGIDTHVDVHYEIEPERILSVAEIDRSSPLTTTQNLVDRGLRMRVHVANVLTGQMILGMDFVPGAKPAKAVQLLSGEIFVPGLAGALDDLTATITTLSDQISQLPIAAIGTELEQTLHGMNLIANGPELKESLRSLQATLAETQTLITHLDTGTQPALKRLPEIAASLQAMIERSTKLIASTDTAYGEESQTKRDLQRLLSQLSDTARSVRLLADYLSDHPQALIQGRDSDYHLK